MTNTLYRSRRGWISPPRPPRGVVTSAVPPHCHDDTISTPRLLKICHIHCRGTVRVSCPTTCHPQHDPFPEVFGTGPHLRLTDFAAHLTALTRTRGMSGSRCTAGNSLIRAPPNHPCFSWACGKVQTAQGPTLWTLMSSPKKDVKLNQSLTAQGKSPVWRWAGNSHWELLICELLPALVLQPNIPLLTRKKNPGQSSQYKDAVLPV